MRRFRGTTAQLDANALELRRKQTPTEEALWQRLRNRQLAGLKFRRQHPVGPFVLDFYCAEHRLAVELDGASHDERQAYDAERTAWLNANGIRVVRFPNDDVVVRVDWVLGEIERTALTASPSPDCRMALTPSPSPDRGMALTPSPSPDRGMALTPSPSPDRGTALTPSPSPDRGRGEKEVE